MLFFVNILVHIGSILWLFGSNKEKLGKKLLSYFLLFLSKRIENINYIFKKYIALLLPPFLVLAKTSLPHVTGNQVFTTNITIYFVKKTKLEIQSVFRMCHCQPSDFTVTSREPDLNRSRMWPLRVAVKWKDQYEILLVSLYK